jgi:hypothetical protein
MVSSPCREFFNLSFGDGKLVANILGLLFVVNSQPKLDFECCERDDIEGENSNANANAIQMQTQVQMQM